MMVWVGIAKLKKVSNNKFKFYILNHKDVKSDYEYFLFKYNSHRKSLILLEPESEIEFVFAERALP